MAAVAAKAARSSFGGHLVDLAAIAGTVRSSSGGHRGDAKSGFGSHCRPPGGSGHHRGCQTVLAANAVAATVGCQASLNFVKRYFIFLYVVRQPPHLKK